MPQDWLTRNMFMREVEQPTNTQPMSGMAGGGGQGGFGGSEEQAMGMMQSPAVQQMLHQWGISFDPNQVRQSPFFPNSFMQQHPRFGGAMTGAMANVASTPQAPLVSGAGSGLTRGAQGMMGGPEMLRQYHMQQMMSPFQGISAMMPQAEYGRKEELLKLLQQQSEGNQQLEQQKLQQKQQAPIRTPYGMYTPGQATDPSLVGQPEHAGSQSLTPLFKNQGQQAFPAQGSGHMDFFNPAALGAQADAQHPDRAAKADEQRKETAGGMAGAKVDETKSRAELNRKRGNAAGTRGGAAGKDYSKNYDAIEKDVTPKIQALQRAAAAAKTPQEKAQYEQQIADLNQNRETRKGNIDKQRGDPGASQRRPGDSFTAPIGGPPTSNQMMAPNAGGQQTPPQQQQQGGNQVNPQEINQHPEMQGQEAGWYRDNQSGGQFYWDGQQVTPGPQAQHQLLNKGPR